MKLTRANSRRLLLVALLAALLGVRGQRSQGTYEESSTSSTSSSAGVSSYAAAWSENDEESGTNSTTKTKHNEASSSATGASTLTANATASTKNSETGIESNTTTKHSEASSSAASASAVSTNSTSSSKSAEKETKTTAKHSQSSSSSASASASSTNSTTSSKNTETGEEKTTTTKHSQSKSSSTSTSATSTKTKTTTKTTSSNSHFSTEVRDAIREAILKAEVDTIAKHLIESDDVVELGFGFTFPSNESETYLIKTDSRSTDPDVVALKGMAKAAITKNIAKKLAEVFIVAIYGPDFDNKICLGDPDSYYTKTVTKNHTTTTTIYGYTTYTNDTGTYTVYREPETEEEYWENTILIDDDLDMDLYEEAMGSVGAEDGGHLDCYTQEEIDTIRKSLLDDFGDKELMMEIVEGNPEGSPRARSLLIVGTPVHSWLCSDCWKRRFCNKNVYWCPQ